METKPYSLQSPEQIAKDYGGNKQRIAEAMQMGIIDPTAGTLAGMFIDRMRAAQQQEMVPQQTVAQQVFAPPAPPAPPMGGYTGAPAGLGATPQAATMSAMPPQAMGGPAPQIQEAMPAMAAGGLTTLPVPNSMFDEPDNGGYAAGGLVAFQTGGEVEDEYPSEDTLVIGPQERTGRITVKPETPDFAVPGNLYGFERDMGSNWDALAEYAPRQTRRSEEFAGYLEGQLTPEERHQRRQQDIWMALGQMGARIASTPGSLLQAVGAGIGDAVPALASSARERRAEERDIRQSLLAEERLGNQELNERAAMVLEMMNRYGGFAEAMKDRAFQDTWNSLDRATQERIAQWNNAAGITQQRIGSGATVAAARISATAGERREIRALENNILQTVQQLVDRNGPYYRQARSDPRFVSGLINELRTQAGLPAIAPRADPLGLRR